MKTFNGGPAFPNHGEWRCGAAGTQSIHWEGMTLRDYFAAKAMQGLLSDSNMYAALSDVARSAGKTDASGLASAAYQYADAMLKEREL